MRASTRKLHAAVACALVAGAGAAHAAYRAQPCGNDPHIQCAVYDPNEVYVIAAAKGAATLILLEPGEKIVDNGAAAGYGSAWQVQPNEKGILIKEENPNPDSNFLVVTNKRNYTFSLVDTASPKSATWVLSFSYPDKRDQLEEAAAQKDEERTSDVREALGARHSNPRAPKKNTDYMMQGDSTLAPTDLWDDGRFTYFEYATGRDLPAGIYVKTPDGHEAVPNQHMDGDTLVIHQISKEFVVRSGQAVLGIRNDAFNPDGDHYNARGVTVPGEVRIYNKDQDKGKPDAE